MIELRALSKADMEQVRIWRNEMPEGLRTPFDLTREMQEDYYRDVICNRESHTRYWGIWSNEEAASTYPPSSGFIGYGGIENIQWESRLAEISILIGPDFRRHGYGEQAVVAILDRAFRRLNLKLVYGECYECNPAILFWRKLLDRWMCEHVMLPGYRKLWNGAEATGLYFAIREDSWYNGDINARNS